MTQMTAVVLDEDRNERDDIRMRLSHCGVVPVCFKDEWICLENIYHIKPRFAVLRSDSCSFTTRFINVANAIRNNFPVVVLAGNGMTVAEGEAGCAENVIYLRYPATEQDFQDVVNRLVNGSVKPPCGSMLAGSDQRKSLNRRIPNLAASREPILICGPKGAGKKRLAREIHRRSLQGDAAFQLIQASAITPRWIDDARSWLAHRPGVEKPFRTIVVEHVEKIPLALQSQMALLFESAAANLKALDEPAMRLISLTRHDLAALAGRGRFKEDLYHRLSVLKVVVPALQHHLEDIRLMAEYFAIQFGIHLKGTLSRLSDTVMDAFLAYPWPGNVSELKQVVSQLIKMEFGHFPGATNGTTGTVCRPETMCPALGGVDEKDVRQFLHDGRELSLKQAKKRYVVKVEKKMLKAALEKTGGNCKQAAVLLDISYKSMLNKAKAYQLV